MDDSERVVLEEQFVLRIPAEEAKRIHEVLRHKPEKLKKIMKLDLNLENNYVVVNIAKTKLFGSLKKLPTIIESYKTNICNNKSVMFKTADICYIAECGHENIGPEKVETNQGICPPVKNVKAIRFRKTMYNTEFAIEAESVSKELYYLLSTDLEAVSSKFEVSYEGNINCKSIKQYA